MSKGELMASAEVTRRKNILVKHLDKHEVKSNLWLVKKKEWEK